MHWFDGLAHPQSRRSVLKAGALAGAAALLPGVRVPAARAAGTEQCFASCRKDAEASYDAAEDRCIAAAKGNRDSVYAALATGPSPLLLILVAGSLALRYECSNRADLHYLADSGQCYAPECGDPKKYPGGTDPSLCKGLPGQWTPCGPTVDSCCPNQYAVCQQCKKGPVCCRIGGDCCGSSG